jgi:hypothetical protein
MLAAARRCQALSAPIRWGASYITAKTRRDALTRHAWRPDRGRKPRTNWLVSKPLTTATTDAAPALTPCGMHQHGDDVIRIDSRRPAS